MRKTDAVKRCLCESIQFQFSIQGPGGDAQFLGRFAAVAVVALKGFDDGLALLVVEVEVFHLCVGNLFCHGILHVKGAVEGGVAAA